MTTGTQCFAPTTSQAALLPDLTASGFLPGCDCPTSSNNFDLLVLFVELKIEFEFFRAINSF